MSDTNNNIVPQANQACEQGDLDTLKSIIQEHKLFNDELLMTAAQFGHLHIVNYLIDHKISYIHYMHDLVLCRAAESGNIELIDTLIQKGCDVHKNIYTHVKYTPIVKLLNICSILMCPSLNTCHASYTN